MAKKDKKEKKGGLLGRLFGGAKGDEAGEATPPAGGGGGGDERTIAPGYVPDGEAGELTMAPGYVHAGPEKGADIGHVSFGTGRFKRPEGATAGPTADGLDDGAAGRTMAPEYAGADDDMAAGELTMAPGYAGPELTAPAKPTDPFADPFADLGPGEMTMAPGYAGAPGKAPGSGGKAPPADPFADLGAGELTMAPGYAGAPAGKAPRGGGGGTPAPADPFADLGLDGGAGELTMAPGYAGAELTAPKKPADPFADPFADLGPGPGAGDLTMAPGYAGAPGKAAPRGGKAPPADPFADAFDVGGDAPDLTMAPGYASGGAKPARGAPRPGEPFIELDAADLTMAPAYAPPGGGPAKPPRALDPFADLEVEPAGDPGNRTMAPDYAQPGAAKGSVDAFDIDLGGPPIGGPAGAPVIPEDAFSFEPAVVGAPPPRPVTPATGGEPFDPFGPALLDDPFAQAPAGTPPAPATPAVPASPPTSPAPAAPLAGVDDDDDFRGERTMVDLTTDVDMLATLESTDELPTPDTPPPVELEGALEVGAALPPPVATPPPAMTAPARLAPLARPMFQGARPDAGGTRHIETAAEVVLDAARGLVFAPALDGPGWTSVPTGFHRLSDGAIVGRGRVEGRDVIVAATAAAPASGDELRLDPFPAGVKVDRATRAVLWPTALEDRLAWRPPQLVRVDEGLLFVLPEGARFEDDGAVVVPATTPVTPGGEATDPTHGRVLSRSSYLGLIEEVHEDGWARLTLPAGASVEPGRLVLPAVDARGTPPLLRPERLPDGRVTVPLPSDARAAGGVVWVPPSAAIPADEGEPWSDRDAAVVETRHYAGVREELLADDWVRLELPVGARVERAATTVRVVIPPEYSRLGDPVALLELERLPCGSLAFDLPPGAECLGWRVLVPPASTTPAGPTARRPAREVVVTDDELGPHGARRAPEPAAPVEVARTTEVKPEKDPDPPSRKMKALDLFRKDKKKPQNDTITFDGVLRSESTGTGGAVSPDVPAPAAEPPKAEVVATVPEPEPVAAAVEAPPVEAEAESGDVAAAVTGAFSLDDAPATAAAQGSTDDGLDPEPLEPAMPEPTLLEPQLDLSSPSEPAEADAGAEAASGGDDAGGGEEGGASRTGRRKRKKGK